MPESTQPSGDASVSQPVPVGGGGKTLDTQRQLIEQEVTLSHKVDKAEFEAWKTKLQVVIWILGPVALLSITGTLLALYLQLGRLIFE